MHKSNVPMAWRRFKNKYNLVGSRCIKCDKHFYPPRIICPICRRAGEMEDFEFSGDGKIVSFTIIRSGPHGFDKQTPYPIAIVELDEGANVTGQIVDYDESELKIGQKVRASFRKIYEDGKEGIIHYGIKFKPVKVK